jgi:hypothetical protein
MCRVPHHCGEKAVDVVYARGHCDSRRRFLVSEWAYPDFENAETFVGRLVHSGLIAVDHSVEAALRSQPQDRALRTTQRHILQATGLTHGAIRQIERARHATNLLKQGASILSAAYEAGYFDQAHLTRSLKRFIGQTPAQIIRAEQQLSFLYNTEPSSAAKV